MAPAEYRFADFQLQIGARRLLRGGQAVALGGRAFDLLRLLAERAGEVVGKDELLAHAWPGRIVTENNLAVHMAALRKVLGPELVRTVAGHGYALVAPLAATASVLPPAVGPRLVGREDELAAGRAALAVPGCITLVGPGGVGKSSLARAWFDEWRAASAGPAWWVELTGVARADELAPALLRTLGAETDAADMGAALLRQVGPGAALLVLDNAEHLIEPVAALAASLRAGAPGLRLCVTSQLPLAIAAERVQPLAPLKLPAAGDSDEQALARGAVALLIDRIRAADPGYPLPPASWPLLRALSSGLDGLPLALEMAAARVPLLGLQQVHDALDQRFAMLRQARRDSPLRHRSLQAALDWSYELLSAHEQRLFRVLGVLPGGFTTELALAVEGQGPAEHWAGVERMTVLRQRSLLVRDGAEAADPPRHRLLESPRAYALARLAAAGEEHAARSRLLAALQALCAQAQADGVASAAGRERVMAEMANVREAVAWGLQHEPAAAVRLAVEVSLLAVFTPWRREATDLLASCEATAERLDDAALRANWCRHYATQLLFRGDARAGPTARRAVSLCREAGVRVGLFWALVAALRAGPDEGAASDVLAQEMAAVLARCEEEKANVPNGRAVMCGTLATLCANRGDAAGELEHRRAELDAARAAGLPQAAAAAETNIAKALVRLGRHGEARQRLLAFIDAADADSGNLAYARLFLVQALLQAGDLAAARAEMPAALAACRRHGVPDIALLAARLAVQRGHPRNGALLLGHARQLYAARGLLLPGGTDGDLEHTEALLRQQLPAQQHGLLQARGAELDDGAADALLFAAADSSAA
jgi:non-specific serine/threonine protein kinase